MSNQINPRDWEILSAYLDGELNESDVQRIKDRARTDENLRSVLESLRLTRAVLRSQPALRAPRNFTLTPQMAGVIRHRAPATIFPFMRLTSALATFFFIILSVGNMLAIRTQPVLISQSNAVQQPAFGMGGGGGGEFESEESLPESQALPAEPQAAMEAGDLTAESLLVEPVPAETDVRAKTMAPSMSPETQPPMEALQQAPQAIEPLTVEESTDLAKDSRATIFSMIAILQVILAILAIFTGAIALYLYRSVR